MLSSNKKILPLMTLLLVFGVVCLIGCSGQKDRPSDTDPVLVSVESFPEAAVPGESVTLVWRFALAEDWHLYWAGRNDSGYPPRIDLELPEGWLAGGLQWPAPERYLSAGDILDHVYFGELVLIQKLGAPSAAVPGGKIDIKADVQWLACREMCVPGSKTLTLELPVANRMENVEPNRATEAAARLPGPLPPQTLETKWEGDTFHIHHPRAHRLTFMPTDDCGRLADLLHDGQAERLALRFKPKGETVGPVRGLITIESGAAEPRTYWIDFPAVLLETASP